VKHVQGLSVVYFDQNRESIIPEWTLKRTLCETGDHVIFQDRSIHVISWAKRFLFSAEHLEKRIADLSGGERAKAIIAKLMLQKADLLLLDEPTNDIDISTMETLEEGLLDFGGAVVLVSHDRFMLQKVCSSFIGLDGSGKATVYADYDQWESTLKPTAAQKKDKKRSQEKTSTIVGTKKLSYKDQREYDQMEETILLLENQMTEKRRMTEDPELATNSKKLDQAFSELDACQDALDKHYARWAELEAMLR
jgi:ATP-binding cassette subfamily F protein uup